MTQSRANGEDYAEYEWKSAEEKSKFKFIFILPREMKMEDITKDVKACSETTITFRLTHTPTGHSVECVNVPYTEMKSASDSALQELENKLSS